MRPNAAMNPTMRSLQNLVNDLPHFVRVFRNFVSTTGLLREFIDRIRIHG
jgi:hypothetical protein